MVGIPQMLAHVIMLLWRGFMKLMNDSISIDCKQQRLTSANLSKQGNVLEGNKAHRMERIVYQ